MHDIGGVYGGGVGNNFGIGGNELNTQGRVENSVKNSALGAAVQISGILLGLIVRTFFIHCLSAEYLGVNGLFSNILTLLSLAEMGVGTAVVFNMYRPIAENDRLKIAKLMNLYKTAYRIIGCVVAAAGLCLIPFLGHIIKDQPQIDDLTLIYVLYLSNAVFSYFFAYKRSIFSADQRERVLHAFKLGSSIARTVFQIAILVFSQNFVLYLLAQIVCTLAENIFVSFYADRKYSFLKEYSKEKLSKEERRPVMKNIRALFVYKIGGKVLEGTDNIVISAFDGIANVGLLSNYTLVTGSVQMLLSQISGSVTASVGNFIAEEDAKRHESLLNTLTFLNFILYGGSAVILTAALDPFMQIWAGGSYCLDFRIVFVHCINVYIFGMMNSIWTFRTSMGLFVHGKWRPLISAVINVVVSIWWAKYAGLFGVLLGTTFTRAVTNVWYDPYIVYRYGLKKMPWKYYLKWLFYLFIIAADVFIVRYLLGLIMASAAVKLISACIVSSSLFICSVIVFFRKSEPYRYFYRLAGEYTGRVKQWFSSKRKR